jgi:hypothetical protein
MSVIQRSIEVAYGLRVYFTQAAFHPANLVLKTVLAIAPAPRASKVLVVVDEALAQRNRLTRQIDNCFAAHAISNLVCP